MAQRVITSLLDDLDGTASDDVSTVQFGLDGVVYEIDLTALNAARLRESLEEYVNHGRRIGGRRNTQSITDRTRPHVDPAQGKAMRDWLRGNGWPETKSRGRIPEEAQRAYHARAEVKVATARQRRAQPTKATAVVAAARKSRSKTAAN